MIGYRLPHSPWNWNLAQKTISFSQGDTAQPVGRCSLQPPGTAGAPPPGRKEPGEAMLLDDQGQQLILEDRQNDQEG